MSQNKSAQDKNLLLLTSAKYGSCTLYIGKDKIPLDILGEIFHSCGMTKRLFNKREREEIFTRCYWSANAAGLSSKDLNSVINLFEYSNIKPAKIGNIIKYISTLFEENNKKSREKYGLSSF